MYPPTIQMRVQTNIVLGGNRSGNHKREIKM